jgi:hypothetical protein
VASTPPEAEKVKVLVSAPSFAFPRLSTSRLPLCLSPREAEIELESKKRMVDAHIAPIGFIEVAMTHGPHRHDTRARWQLVVEPTGCQFGGLPARVQRHRISVDYRTLIEHGADRVWGAIRCFDRYGWAGDVRDVQMENGEHGNSIGAAFQSSPMSLST